MTEVEMDLERDLFMVTAEPDRPTDREVVVAIETLGFKPEVVREDRSGRLAAKRRRGERESGEMPALVRAALDQASREGKLVLVDFHAKWCQPCRRMFKETYSDPRVAAKLESYVFLKVDTDDYPEVSSHFGVVGIPDARILAPDGTELGRIFDFKTAVEVLEILKDAERTAKGR